MPRSRTLAAALVGGLALLGAACGGSATATSTDATAAASAKKAASATTVAGATSAPSNDPGAMPADGTRPAGGPDGDGDGGPGRGGPGGFGDLAAAATAIGISETDLRTAVDGGQTIAQVAATKGVSVDTVVAAMVAAMKAHFEPEVASGEHTQAEVDQIMANATEQMTAVVNGQQPAFGPGGPGGRGDGDDDGDHGGPGDDDGGSTSGSGGRKANTGKSSTTVGA